MSDIGPVSGRSIAKIEEEKLPSRTKKEKAAFSWKSLRHSILINRYTYFLFVPVFLQLIIFRYVTLYGLKIAFLEFNAYDNFKSPYVGLENFKIIFNSYYFSQILKNTLIITGMRILIGFPVPVILALLLNEMKKESIKRTCQTFLYLPNFLNWVILYGIFRILFNDSDGVFLRIFNALGLKYSNFTKDPNTIRIWLALSGTWRGMGWGTIIYLAAIAGVDPALYENAVMDGAGKWKQAIHITIPAIFPIIAISLILGMSGILQEDFQQILVFAGGNAALQEKTTVFETWIYGMGLMRGAFSVATALGLFQISIGLLLTLGANWLAGKIGYEVLW